MNEFNLESLVSEIVQRIVDQCKPQKIILFGSSATGKMTTDSDIDLLVLEQDAINARSEALRIRAALRGISVPFDVIVMTPDRFEETKNVIGGIAYPANKYGKVIYEAA